MTMSEGGRAVAAPRSVDPLRAVPDSSRAPNIGYVVIDETRTPEHLIAFVIDAWNLDLIAREGSLALYRPAHAQ